MFFKKQTQIIIEEKNKSYLVSYHWYNNISGVKGNSSIILDLKESEKITKTKIKEIQEQILNTYILNGNIGDPTAIVITGFFRLDDE